MGSSFGSLSEYTGYVLAALAVWILLRCARSMLSERPAPEIRGILVFSDKDRRELDGRDCLIGRAAWADVVIDDPGVKPLHAALRRGADGVWTLTDRSGGETFVGGRAVEGEALLKPGDRLRFGKIAARWSVPTRKKTADADRPAPVRRGGAATLLLLTLFEFTLLLQLVSAGAGRRPGVVLAFALLAAAGWGLYVLDRRDGPGSFACEPPALLLTAAGFSVAASSTPEAMGKQSALFLAAVVLYVVLVRWLRGEERVRKTRWAAGGLAVVLLGLTLLLSESIWGAKNWLSVAGNSLQPSEFVKIAFVYAGAAGMDRTLSRRQALPFVVFSAAIVGTLALMGDFGTALVFFSAFLVIVYLRTGSLALPVLSLTAAAAAVAAVLRLRPYVAARFAHWGRAWDDPLGAGFQQVRAMSALSAGGLFGRGAGRGWLKDVVAADTDLVFGVVGEELGLIAGICCVLAVLLLAVAARRSARTAPSGYYAIAAAGAVTIYMVQMSLNVFGSMDLLPFTGVTFPFVSRGGSSLIACWGLLAFVKAADAPAASKPEAKLPVPARASEKKPAEKKPAPAKKPAAPKTPASKKSGAGKGAGK